MIAQPVSENPSRRFSPLLASSITADLIRSKDVNACTIQLGHPGTYSSKKTLESPRMSRRLRSSLSDLSASYAKDRTQSSSILLNKRTILLDHPV